MDKPTLDTLTDAELLTLMHRVYRRSRENNAELVRILVAVHVRRLFLKKAHPSLFEFCVKVLGMSNASAQRFSVAARLAAQFPELIERIATGDVHLTSLVLMRYHLTEENVTQLLDLARGRNRYQVEELLASVAPRPDAPSRMRKLPTPRSGQNVAPVARPMEPLAPARYRVQFNADRETHDDIIHARDLMIPSNPTGDLDRVFKYCVRAGVERLEARQRGLLRHERGRRPMERTQPTRTRHVPRHIRRAVFARDGAQCTFHDEAGHRCSATTLLELDHIDLYAKGGLHSLENLRVRCRAHNRWYAEQTLGKGFIEKRIAERREKRVKTASDGSASASAAAASASASASETAKRSKGATKAQGFEAGAASARPSKGPTTSGPPCPRGEGSFTSANGTSAAAHRTKKPLAKTKEPRVGMARGSQRGLRRSTRQ